MASPAIEGVRRLSESVERRLSLLGLHAQLLAYLLAQRGMGVDGKTKQPDGAGAAPSGNRARRGGPREPFADFLDKDAARKRPPAARHPPAAR